MNAKVNNAVQFREWWRPFAPSMLAEEADQYIESATDSPFMILTAFFDGYPSRMKPLAAVLINTDNLEKTMLSPRKVSVVRLEDHDNPAAAFRLALENVRELLPDTLPKQIVIKPNLCGITSWGRASLLMRDG